MSRFQYFIFHKAAMGSVLPRFLRRVFARSELHRVYVFGRLYGRGVIRFYSASGLIGRT
jgi:hypothetical protein